MKEIDELKKEIFELTHSVLSGWLQCPFDDSEVKKEWNRRVALLKRRLDCQLIEFCKQWFENKDKELKKGGKI